MDAELDLIGSSCAQATDELGADRSICSEKPLEVKARQR
jgi:hypothetical protein